MRPKSLLAAVLLIALCLSACGGAAGTEARPCTEAREIRENPAIGFGNSPMVIDPATQRGPGCFALTPDTEITIKWDGPTTYEQAEFLIYSEVDDSAELLGIDEDPSDGFSLTVTFDADTPPSVISVAAIDTDGQDDPVFGFPMTIYIDPD